MASPQAGKTSANDNSGARGMTAVQPAGSSTKITWKTRSPYCTYFPSPHIRCHPNRAQWAAATTYWSGWGAWFGYYLTMALGPASRRQRTMVWAHHIPWWPVLGVVWLSRHFGKWTWYWYCLRTYIAADLVHWQTAWENDWYQLTLKQWTQICPLRGPIKR